MKNIFHYLSETGKAFCGCKTSQKKTDKINVTCKNCLKLLLKRNRFMTTEELKQYEQNIKKAGNVSWEIKDGYFVLNKHRKTSEVKIHAIDTSNIKPIIKSYSMKEAQEIPVNRNIKTVNNSSLQLENVHLKQTKRTKIKLDLIHVLDNNSDLIEQISYLFKGISNIRKCIIYVQ